MEELLLLLAKYGSLAATYGGLVGDVASIFTQAAAGTITEEQILAEVARIKAEEASASSTLWDVVNS